MSSDYKYELMGAGNAVTDILIQVDDQFLEQSVGGERGGMELVDVDIIKSLLKAYAGQPTHAPGGAAANTVRTAARLGVSSKFMGMLGKDPIGDDYIKSFSDYGCDISAFRRHDEMESGQCLSIITPDKQRTMRTYLGAATELAGAPMGVEDFEGCRTLYIEGYLLFNRELTHTIVRLAKEAGCRIAMDLGSFEVVKASMDMLPAMLRDDVDIILANEDEARAYSGSEDLEDSLNALAELCECAVMKLGDEGAWIKADGEMIVVEPIPSPELVDTTGAGDLWAAGFFYGMSCGLPYEHCGAIGSMLGSVAVSQVGTMIPDSKWKNLKADIDTIISRS